MERRDFIKTPLWLGAALTVPSALQRLTAQSEPAALPPALTPSGRSLFFLPEKLEALRGRIASDPGAKERWIKFLARADALVSGTSSRGRGAGKSAGSGESPGLRTTPSGPGGASFVLGLAWRVTGDERYAKRLRELLLTNAGASQWGSEGVITRNPPWHSALGTAGSVVTSVVGCDALAGFLPTAESQQIKDAMKRLGVLPILEDWVLPAHRIHALDSMGHNWWSVCVAGAGVGALALLKEDPRALGWVGEIETALQGFFDYQGMVLLNKTANFDPAGAFYESVHYAGYALESYLTFRLARVNALSTPPPRIPVLERVAEFFAHSLYPATDGDLAVDFGDSALKPDAAPTIRLLATLGFSRELSQWYLQREDAGSTDPISLLYVDDLAGTARNALPASNLYPAIGWATLRDSWKNDATFLGIKSGFTWNHAHADGGSFVLYHAGRPLLIDSGKCSYGRGEYTDYYRQSLAHNVVLFNGQGQAVEDFWERGGKFPGQVHELMDGLGLRYVYADATGPMARYFTRNYRHWLWIDGAILVIDDIRSHEDGRFDWLLHYAGEAQVEGATVQLSNGPAKASLTMLYPERAIVREKTGLAPDAPDEKVKYLALSPPLNAREQKFLVSIIPDRPGVAAPKVELLHEKETLGVRVTNSEHVTDVYLNLQADGRRMHLNSNNTIAGWETDAYLLALTRPAGAAGVSPATVVRYFVAGASYLRCDGQTALDCLSKVTATFQPGADPQVLIEGQLTFVADFLGVQAPRTVRVNGRSVAFTHDAARGVFRYRHVPA